MALRRLVLGVTVLATLTGCGRAATPPVAQANRTDAAFQAQGVLSRLADRVLDTDRDGFDRYDTNRDGRLTPAEVPFLKAETFASKDADQDGKLTYAETRPSAKMVSDTAKLVGKSLSAFFKSLDKDADGKLSAEEAPDLFATRNARSPLGAEGLLSALEEANTALEEAPVRATGKNPVHMMPGFVMPPFTFFPMRNALKKAGYTEFTILNHWPWFGRIEEFGAASRMHVDALKKKTGAKKVELLGHSMGGLTGRALIKYHGGLKDVAHLVTFGTPHHGTMPGPLAGWLLPSVKEMSPGSEFLTALNEGDLTPGAIKYTSVHASWDEIVIPGRNVDLEGAENPMVPNTFHIHMMFVGETHRLAIEALEK